MKYIDIRDIVGADIRFWHVSGERVHYTHHMYYNSPYETDYDCGNCDGGRCDGCRRIVEPSHLEFGIYTNMLEDAVRQAAPELTSGEISDLCYMAKNTIYHNGEMYELLMPTEHWLKENHPEVLTQLIEVVYMVQIHTTELDEETNHHVRHTISYRFDTEVESVKFFEEQREHYRNMAGIKQGAYVPKNDTSEWSYFAAYDRELNPEHIEHVEIFRSVKNYGDFLSTMYDGFLHYNGQIFEYKASKIVSVN